MSLVAQPKPKAYAKKRQAQHHHQSKHYLKAYLPYLPMLGIIGIGAVISRFWSSIGLSGLSQASALSGPPAATTRLASLSGNQSSDLFYLVLAITFVAFAAFIFSHSYRLHKFINKGEVFVSKHPSLDVALVLVITVGVILTRTNSFS